MKRIYVLLGLTQLIERAQSKVAVVDVLEMDFEE
jgi:hypothetical protein